MESVIMSTEAGRAVAAMGALVFASLVAAGGALVVARVLGLDRLWLGMADLPRGRRYRPAVGLGWIGIGVGGCALGVLLGAPQALLAGAWAAAGVFVVMMGGLVLMAANQARDAQAWVRALPRATEAAPIVERVAA